MTEDITRVADDCLTAASDVAIYLDADELPWPPDLRVSDLCPEILKSWTPDEIEQASHLLARLGMLNRPRIKAKRRDP